MKRLWAIIFLLILIPSVSAIIELEGPARDIYNLGDEVNVEGYILVNQDVFGFFRIIIDCETEIPILTKSISLKKDTKKSFDESFIVPFYIAGDCSLKISVESAGDVVEQARSSAFLISKDLEGSFELGDKLIQLGKDIEIEGQVFRLDGDDIEGNAVVYFKKNNTIINVGSSVVDDGEFEYSVSSVAYPSGIYNLEIDVIDIYGNQYLFTEIEPFTLVNEIYVFAKPGKVNVLPGTALKISGEAKTILQENIPEADVSLIVNETVYETKLKNSEFEFELILERDTKSGRHDVEVIVEDYLGNIGRTSTNFNVNAIPTTLYVETDVKTYIPGTMIEMKPILLDQGGDFIIEDISVELIDVDGNNKLTMVVKTNEIIEYEFDRYATPGSWEIKSYATGLVHEDQINVGETLAADYKLAGQILTITNIGNINYKRPVEIRLVGEEEFVLVKKKRLDPGENYEVNLGEGVKSGVYDVFVGDKEFNEVTIDGFIKRNWSWLYWLLSLIVFGLVAHFLVKNVRKRKRKKVDKEEEEKHLASKVKEFLSAKGLHHKEKPKEESKEDRIGRYKKEFKEKILKDISKREKKIKQEVSRFLPKEAQEYLKLKKAKNDDEERKSLFNIFSMKGKKKGGEK